MENPIMIDEARTLEIFGYTSDELSRGSQKKIVAVCDMCGVCRVVPKQSYRMFCSSCSHKGKFLGKKSPSWRGGKEIINCDECGKEIKRHSSVTNGHKNHFCCRKCQVKWQKNKRIYKQRSLNDRILMSCGCQKIPIEDFNGFLTDQKYCPKFNESCREHNREKYGRLCFLCGKDETDNGCKLSVHHVDRDKDQGCNDHDWSLVPLCKHHHATSHNDLWEARIVYLLDRVWLATL